MEPTHTVHVFRRSQGAPDGEAPWLGGEGGVTEYGETVTPGAGSAPGGVNPQGFDAVALSVPCRLQFKRGGTEPAPAGVRAVRFGQAFFERGVVDLRAGDRLLCVAGPEPLPGALAVTFVDPTSGSFKIVADLESSSEDLSVPVPEP